MWYPLPVNHQTWMDNGFCKTEGYICVNVELRRRTKHIHTIKSFAYSECNRLNEKLRNPLFEKETQDDSN